jgi:hypothetical protein
VLEELATSLFAVVMVGTPHSVIALLQRVVVVVVVLSGLTTLIAVEAMEVLAAAQRATPEVVVQQSVLEIVQLNRRYRGAMAGSHLLGTHGQAAAAAEYLAWEQMVLFQHLLISVAKAEMDYSIQ